MFNRARGFIVNTAKQLKEWYTGRQFLEAAERGQVSTVRNYILANAANPARLNITDDFGNNALMLALRQAHYSVALDLLAEKKVNVNAANSIGDTPLMLITHYGHYCLFDSILRRKDLDLNMANNLGETALMIATQRCHIAMVQILVGHPRIQVNAKNKAGDTALTIAASQHNKPDLILSLLNHSEIQVDIVNSKDQTAEKAALEKGHLELTAIIAEKRMSLLSAPRAFMPTSPRQAQLTANQALEEKQTTLRTATTARFQFSGARDYQDSQLATMTEENIRPAVKK